LCGISSASAAARHCCHVEIGVVSYVGGEWATLRQSRSSPSPLVFSPSTCVQRKKRESIGLLSFCLSFHLLLHSLSFRVGAIIFRRPKWLFVLTSFSLSAKTTTLQKNFSPLSFPSGYECNNPFCREYSFTLLLRRLYTLYFKKIVIHFSEMIRLLRQRHLPIGGKTHNNW
jgi:hypothetical protein